VQSCEQARQDYAAAQIAVLRITGFKPFELDGCQPALMGVICAYHFPKCRHDFHEQESICMRTCNNMMDMCQYKEMCDAGGNVTCNSTSYMNQAMSAGGQLGDAAAGGAAQADAATGGALSSGASAAGGAASAAGSSASAAASSASSSASNAAGSAAGSMGGGRRAGQWGGGATNGVIRAVITAEEQVTALDTWTGSALAFEALQNSVHRMPVLRDLRPHVQAAREHLRQAHRTGRALLQQDGKDSSALYYAQFAGKVTLSEFSQVGERCDACLTEFQLRQGKMCEGPGEQGGPSQEWTCRYKTRFDRADCTAVAPHSSIPPSVLPLLLLVAVAVAMLQ